jgi:putative phosphoesterase
MTNRQPASKPIGRVSMALSALPARIGLISDTHGLLREKAMDLLSGCSLILHAGDIGHPEVLRQLSTIAPTHAVLGNVDEAADSWPWPLSELLAIELSDASGRLLLDVLLVHDRQDLPAPSDLDSLFARAGAVAEHGQLVVFGHSHQPTSFRRKETLFVNPGSAGRRRFKLPVCAAQLLLRPRGGELQLTHVDLL